MLYHVAAASRGTRVACLVSAPTQDLPRHFLRLEGKDLLYGIATDMLEDLVRVLTETRCPFLEGCRCLFERKGKGDGLEARGPWTQIVKSITRIPSSGI